MASGRSDRPPTVGRSQHYCGSLECRLSTGGVLVTKSECKMLASTCLYSLCAWLLLLTFCEFICVNVKRIFVNFERRSTYVTCEKCLIYASNTWSVKVQHESNLDGTGQVV